MKQWTFTLTVSQIWIDDGFNPTADDIKHAILSTLLGDAYDHEVIVELKS